jgi:hypothetical protein
LYKKSLGDNINESILFDQRILIKILYQIFKMLNIYASINSEVQEYLEYIRKSINYVERLN